jgi:replicative DNA helicase
VATLADLLTSKIPPHSLEAERAVLGGMLLDRESLPKAVELLKPSDFYKEGHRKIFDSMLALFDRNEPVDLLTISEELRRRSELDEVGGPATLGALVEEAATAAHLLSYGGHRPREGRPAGPDPHRHRDHRQELRRPRRRRKGPG